MKVGGEYSDLWARFAAAALCIGKQQPDDEDIRILVIDAALVADLLLVEWKIRFEPGNSK